jgi:hypothetical protein
MKPTACNALGILNATSHEAAIFTQNARHCVDVHDQEASMRPFLPHNFTGLCHKNFFGALTCQKDSGFYLQKAEIKS